MWTDFSQFPGEFSAPATVALPAASGVKLLPLRLICNLVTGETIVRTEWSGEEIACIEAPANYQPGDAAACDETVWAWWQQWKQCAEQWEGGIDPFVLVELVQLADINDKPLYDANVAIENAAWEQAQEQEREARTQTPSLQQDDGDESAVMLMDDAACVITNETERFAITGIHREADSSITVTWGSCSDHLYEVQTCDTLSTQTVWISRTLMIGENGATSWTDTSTSGFNQRFYRVQRYAFYDDFDDDGLSNWGEFLAGTDIRNPDTDGDGRRDGEDPNPRLPCITDVSPTNLSCAIVNHSYSATISVSGDSPPCLFVLTNSSLPSGLSLTNATPTSVDIAGTPIAAGEGSFTLNIADTNGCSLNVACSICIVPDAITVVFSGVAVCPGCINRADCPETYDIGGVQINSPGLNGTHILHSDGSCNGWSTTIVDGITEKRLYACDCPGSPARTYDNIPVPIVLRRDGSNCVLRAGQYVDIPGWGDMFTAKFATTNCVPLGTFSNQNIICHLAGTNDVDDIDVHATGGSATIIP